LKFTKISVTNYKGLKESDCKLSEFVCIVGENNAGKSSLLQAILLFVNGSKLSKDAFYDQTKDILITVNVSEVSDEALSRLGEEHEQKLKKYVVQENITLARRYSTDGSSKLRVIASVPKDLKYRAETVDSTLSGKKGKDIVDLLRVMYPEIGDEADISSVTTQKRAKELIEAYVSKLQPDDLVLEDIPLPTGFDNSIRAILPEPIYIPAVKDFIDDLKTKESASFGKLLNILLDVIEEDLAEAAETFESLRKKLNRIQNPDGLVVDDRMDRVKRIESTIQDNLKETFRDVRIELEIPPPEIKTVLSNAAILADDGVRGPIDNKGDGFKRAITFSILRAYVQLSQDKDWRKDPDDQKPTRERFIFLFEEPELYLHPKAQNILFEALSLIAQRHQTIVTTHSPLFFSANETTTFAKIYKKEIGSGEKPIGICKHIDVGNLNEKDKFQLISFESSNHAFFSRHIVLVEGDSELIVFPYLARLLNRAWDFRATSTSLIKSSGKGSFQRYRDFFARFDVDISLIADLDTLLDGFEKLGASQIAKNLRNELIIMLDAVVDAENLKPNVSPKLVREELQKDRFRTKIEALTEARSQGDNNLVAGLLQDIFLFERSKPRLEVLQDSSRAEILSKKRELIAELRKSGVYILEKGAIEAYYPSTVTGPDKPSKAQSFCAQVCSREQGIALCEKLNLEGELVSELDIIFDGVFGDQKAC
jgi:putative ATP-dependent endonuclease of the OLD family